MLRDVKGKSLMGTKKTIILLVLLAVLSVQPAYAFANDGVKLSAPEAQATDQTFAPTNQLGNVELGGQGEDELNVTFWIRDWENKTSIRNLDVKVFDLKRQLSSSYVPNRTGFVNLKFLPAGPYVVSVLSGNRTVGYQKLDLQQSGTILVKTWSYDLNLTLVDKDWKPLGNHTVFIYDSAIFRAPNYTILRDDVERKENYTLLTDQVGSLVAQNETNGNGTASFTRLWNGTYRVKVLRRESWTEEYVLGQLVRVRQPAVSGEFILSLQRPENETIRCYKADLVLRFITESNDSVQNADVYVRDRSGYLFFKDLTNETGFVEHRNIYVVDGSYAVSTRYGNRTLGYQIVNATEPGIFTIKVWAYNLTVAIFDLEEKPLKDHVVFLYDQLVFYSPTNVTVFPANQTGLLINWTKTDENGMAYFKDLWNGTYKIRGVGGQIVGEKVLGLQGKEMLTMRANKTYLVLRFITGSNEPLLNATVYIYNSVGNLIFRDYTDQHGSVSHDGVYVGNYKVVVEWMRAEVWSGFINLYQDRARLKTEPIRTLVYRLYLRSLDPSGTPLTRATLTLRKVITPGRYMDVGLRLVTDDRGSVSTLLPSGTYEVSTSYGIYSGYVIVNLASNYAETVRTNIQLNIWLLTIFVSSPLVIITLLLERKRLRKPLEIRRYKNMLSRLESMYKGGQIEYRLYRQLREEYEAKLMELGGREIR